MLLSVWLKSCLCTCAREEKDAAKECVEWMVTGRGGDQVHVGTGQAQFKLEGKWRSRHWKREK